MKRVDFETTDLVLKEQCAEAVVGVWVDAVIALFVKRASGNGVVSKKAELWVCFLKLVVPEVLVYAHDKRKSAKDFACQV